MSRMIENQVVSKGEQILSIQEYTIDGMVFEISYFRYGMQFVEHRK